MPAALQKQLAAQHEPRALSTITCAMADEVRAAKRRLADGASEGRIEEPFTGHRQDLRP